MINNAHVVAPGDTLSRIARKNGFRRWEDVFFHPHNADLRRRRRSPDLIQPGDVIRIPARIDLEARRHEIHRLNALVERHTGYKNDIRAFYAKLRQEQDRASAQMKRVLDGVDTAATVITLLVGIAAMVKQGAAAMKLSGDALKEANRQFLTDFAKNRVEQMRDLAATVANEAIEEPDSLGLMIGKSLAKALCDVSSPSFWAIGWTEFRTHGRWEPEKWSLEAMKEETDRKLAAQEQEALRQQDLRIERYRKAIEDLTHP